MRQRVAEAVVDLRKFFLSVVAVWAANVTVISQNRLQVYALNSKVENPPHGLLLR